VIDLQDEGESGRVRKTGNKGEIMVARHRLRSLAIVCLLLAAFLLSGCYFNILQTARTVGAGKVALTVGSGVLNLAAPGDYNWIFTPQDRITIGLADNVDIGVQSGMMIGPTEEPSFLGVVGDLKIGLVQDPESLSFAIGVGGGYQPGLLGWGVEASVYLDSNLRFLPIFFVYRPMCLLDADPLTIIHHLGGGLHLDLSDHARILIEVDSWNGVLGGGISLDIIF